MVNDPSLSEADQIQAAIYRRMAPERRLVQAVRMHQTMRKLMDSGLQVQHPEMSPQQRQKEIARRVLHAQTE